ncbi:MAG: hypothetical protein C0424_03460 [Sphingobacteriaceae bacterium]|nr:hypothetical protein [Sphingobacteriaceae bacterium]
MFYRLLRKHFLWNQQFHMFEAKRRSKVVGFFIVMGLVTMIVTNLAEWLQGYPMNWLGNGIGVFTLLLGLWANLRGKTDTAAFTLVISVIFVLLSEILRMGLSQAAYLYLIAIIAVVPFIADLNKKYHFETMALMPVFALIFVFVYPFEPWEPLTDTQMWSGHRVNVAFFTLLTFAFIYSMAFANRRLVKNLTEGATRLEAILEQTTYVIWSVDSEFKLVHANRNFHRYFELHTGAKIQIGDNILDLLPQEEKDFWKAQYLTGFEGVSSKFEFQDIVDNKEMHSEVTLYPVYDAEGGIKWISCYANNVTESRRMQKDIANKSLQLEESLDLAGMGTWVSWPQKNELHWDARTAEIMGLDKKSVVVGFEALESRVHPADVSKVMEVVELVKSTNQPQQLEYRIITPDGDLRYIFERAKAQMDERGKLLFIQGYTQDLTELRSEALLNRQTQHLLEEVKSATEFLLEAEDPGANVAQALRRVANAIEAGFTWIFEHRIIDGKAGTALLSPELLGNSISENDKQLLTEGFAYEAMGVGPWYEKLTKGEAISGDATKEVLVGLPARFNLMRFVILPIFVRQQFWGFVGFDGLSPNRTWSSNDENILRGFCNSIGAVIRMGHFQQSLQEAKEIAEKATQTKTNFLSNISHEIRTPMNAIMGLTELLVPVEQDPEKLEYLQAIQYSSDNLLRLINDLLDLNKMEANKMSLDHSPVAVKELLHQFEKVMRYLTRDREVAINLVIDEQLPEWIIGDQVRLNQVLMNLGSNAAKFTEKGEIAVRAKVLSDEPMYTLVRFTFRDTGIGIEADKLESIFESFEQADKQISRKYGGTGLGLTITRKLVEMMGGNIRVQSEPGVGSTFAVELKFEKVLHTGLPQQDLASLDHKDLLGASILVVEDNKINAMLATKLLSNWNARFEVAENGLEGLKRLQAQNYDLVLLDLQMPVMDGFELIEKIRAGEAGEQLHIPVIALTADAFDQTKGKALELGFNDFVSKPLKADELFMKMQAWLQPKAV